MSAVGYPNLGARRAISSVGEKVESCCLFCLKVTRVALLQILGHGLLILGGILGLTGIVLLTLSSPLALGFGISAVVVLVSGCVSMSLALIIWNRK